tara:strand:+ start:40 stop:468 length:429 start_codon:yes stop_codon:yes gene_type:complete
MKILVFLMMVSSISFSQKTEELEKLLLDISRWQRDVSSLQEDAQKDLNVSVDSLIISLKLINSKEYKEELIFKESCCNSFTSKDFDRLERFYTKFFWPEAELFSRAATVEVELIYLSLLGINPPNIKEIDSLLILSVDLLNK